MQIWQKKMRLSLATAIVVLGGSWTADAEPANGKAWTMAARLCADQKACRQQHTRTQQPPRCARKTP